MAITLHLSTLQKPDIKITTSHQIFLLLIKTLPYKVKTKQPSCFYKNASRPDYHVSLIKNSHKLFCLFITTTATINHPWFLKPRHLIATLLNQLLSHCQKKTIYYNISRYLNLIYRS
ncbi:hypothetical protein CBP12_01070 [Oceanisphaera avium]|uniref:Uncharacterized protein n=1 Tax=Oceanisphaera avium TaxID=1903694 RepID=A0A1Y0CU88_9GAMM|nr:hypothetical protein CBP12_01070 [Oceanisphaera avium]